MRSDRVLLFLISSAVVFLMGATFLQASATSQVVSAAGGEPLTAGAPGDASTVSSGVDPNLGSRRGECFDVPLQDLASCLVPPSNRPGRLPPNACFDVPLAEFCER